ncbi:MAG: acyltransferase, partial [Bacteroidota bacterium]
FIKCMKYLPNITPLRFILALLVIVFHVPQFLRNRGLPYFDEFAVFHRGMEAVYMFFSLSGFLIIRMLYLEKATTNSISIKNFYIRRGLRIFPLYFLIVFFGLFYYNFFLSQIGIPFESDYSIIEGLLLAVFFLPNVFAVLHQPGGILEILWSIGIEEQFYLIIAPALTMIKRKYILFFLTVFTLGYFALYASHLVPLLSKYLMLFFYFSFGGLVSICAVKFHFKFRKSILLKWIFLLIFLLYFTTNLFTWASAAGYHAISMVLFGLFLWSVTDKPLFEIKNKKLIYLGKISYGIYMFHGIAMHLIGFLTLKTVGFLNLPDAITIISYTVAVIVLTIVLAHFSYRYYESYFLRLKTKFSVLT